MTQQLCTLKSAVPEMIVEQISTAFIQVLSVVRSNCY